MSLGIPVNSLSSITHSFYRYKRVLGWIVKNGTNTIFKKTQVRVKYLGNVLKPLRNEEIHVDLHNEIVMKFHIVEAEKL